MSSPRFAPWLMPETISSGSKSSRPSVPKRTQSTGVPSVANPVVPSPNSTSSTQSGWWVVMLRAVALRLESGAITASSTPGTSRRACRRALRPMAVMPSSLVSRTFIGVPGYSLPSGEKCPWGVLSYGGVGRQDGNIEHAGLGDQQAIEWVAVQRRKHRHRQRMRVLDRHGSRPNGAHAVGHVTLGWLGQGQPAKAMLDCYLPGARCGWEQVRARVLHEGQVLAKALWSRLKPQ